MASYAICSFLIFIVGITTINAQFMNSMALMFGEAGQELAESLGFGSIGSFLAYSNLNQRVRALNTNVRTGAVGGCESGFIGPLNAFNPLATVNFQNSFLFPPSFTLSLTELTTNNPALPNSFQINPLSVTTNSATVNLVDANSNVAAAFLSYMACPSNNSPLVNTNTGTNPFMG